MNIDELTKKYLRSENDEDEDEEITIEEAFKVEEKESAKATGEKDESYYTNLRLKTIKLYEETKKNKEERGLSLDKITVMEPKYDPFYCGSNNDVLKAQWAYKLWKEYCDTTGVNKVHIRGLHYFIVMKEEKVRPAFYDIRRKTWTVDEKGSYYGNVSDCCNYLSEAVGYARYLAFIPFEGIVDEKNDVTTITIYEEHKATYKGGVSIQLPVTIPSLWFIDFPYVGITYSSFETYLEESAENCARSLVEHTFLEKDAIELNPDLVKPFYIEIWSEKTLPEYIHNIFRQNCVNKVVEGGELSLTVMYNFVQEVNKRGQDGVALYFSDSDPRGNDMPSNMSIKLLWAKCVEILNPDVKVFVTPIALTKEQTEKLGLPRMPISTKSKMSETLKKKFEKHLEVTGFAELQALEARPDAYKQIVNDAIKSWILPMDEISEVIENRKRELRDEIKDKILKEMEKYKDELKEYYNKAVKLVEDIKEKMPEEEKIREQFEEAEKIALGSPIPPDMKFKLDDIKEDIILPDVDPPRIKKDPPIECLFDSRRSKEEQTAILIKNKISKQEVE